MLRRSKSSLSNLSGRALRPPGIAVPLMETHIHCLNDLVGEQSWGQFQRPGQLLLAQINSDPSEKSNGFKNLPHLKAAKMHENISGSPICFIIYRTPCSFGLGTADSLFIVFLWQSVLSFPKKPDSRFCVCEKCAFPPFIIGKAV